MSAAENNQVEIRRLADCTFREALELWNGGFSGYYSDMSTTLDKFVSRMGREAIRPELSVAAFVDGKPAGFVLIAHKTVDGVGIVWNGGTGVHPDQRGKGLAKLLMREAVQAMRESGAATGVLEVVQKNAGAIAAYESSGFRICDGLIGAKRSGPLPADIVARASVLSDEYRVERTKPRQLSRLPFYLPATAWSTAWYNRSDSEGVIVYDKQGNAGAYALARKSFDDDGKLTTIMLFQCATDRTRPDATALLHAALAEAFGPLEEDCKRTTDNLSMSDPVVVEWLEKAGFETVYTQYLMSVQLN